MLRKTRDVNSQLLECIVKIFFFLFTLNQVLVHSPFDFPEVDKRGFTVDHRVGKSVLKEGCLGNPTIKGFVF